MAVLAGCYGQEKPCYHGCVLDTHEYNGYHDSYWYAVVWDETAGRIKEVEYATTAAGGGGWAEIDATPEVARKVYRYLYKCGKARFDDQYNEEQAKEVRKDDTVIVVRGRKVQKGTMGKVFWIGKRYNYYTRTNELRVGIEFDGQREFLPAEYVEVVGWRSRLIHGAERKKAIRNYTMNAMPCYCRTLIMNLSGEEA